MMCVWGVCLVQGAAVCALRRCQLHNHLYCSCVLYLKIQDDLGNIVNNLNVLFRMLHHCCFVNAVGFSVLFLFRMEFMYKVILPHVFQAFWQNYSSYLTCDNKSIK